MGGERGDGSREKKTGGVRGTDGERERDGSRD